ncbi:MAG: AarF/UbiB family protein, partial [Pirellulales bacterium]|nr:AarF/UbiB family protein [Pirellulales bacterium]
MATSTHTKPWPLVSEFTTVLQTPKIAFRDQELKQCHIERNSLGQPRPWSGKFATVFHGTLPNERSLAIRIFNGRSDERRERYAAISDYLAMRNLSSLVSFDYVDNGIRCPTNGKWYPVIRMEWVQGETLFGWLAIQCAKRNTREIESLAGRWLALIAELSEHGIAHGDLQHGNIMVTDTGEIRLVDYDSMCVPELVGRPNLEIGVDPYQHPNRDTSTALSLEIDRFSALMILLVLRALAAAPDLWKKYVESADYDKLLFRGTDLHRPNSSLLSQELFLSPDPSVRKLLAHLCDAYHADFEDTPHLLDLVAARASSTTTTNSPIPDLGVVAEPPPPTGREKAFDEPSSREAPNEQEREQRGADEVE